MTMINLLPMRLPRAASALLPVLVVTTLVLAPNPPAFGQGLPGFPSRIRRRRASSLADVRSIQKGTPRGEQSLKITSPSVAASSRFR